MITLITKFSFFVLIFAGLQGLPVIYIFHKFAPMMEVLTEYEICNMML